MTGEESDFTVIDLGGFVVGLAPCLCCHQVFSFNPRKVPSFTAETREGRRPICANCMKEINQKRVARGNAPWPIEADAYESLPETEL